MDAVEHIDRLARTPHLFVVSDFDGTLAPFADDIYAVVANPAAVDALKQLSLCRDTTVAVLSGRHLEGLQRVFPLRDNIVFGGSHGAETSGADVALTDDMADFLARKDLQLAAIVDKYPGTHIESKPFQRVFHCRPLAAKDPEAAARATAEVLELDTEGYHRQQGKNVVEFSATSSTKGSWIAQQREALGATAVVFIGDDVTDEQGFAVLDQPVDIGVKVGEGDTAAAVRVADIPAAADFLTKLAAARTAFTA